MSSEIEPNLWYRCHRWEALEIPERYDILLAVALGKPKEQVRVDYMDREGDIKYWRDADAVHHVPKRRLEDLILKEFG